ncbi:hypothetical protein [Micromonospora sp. WMMD1082]|uniref:hypothetical protein n=1 Tax=Micromonospora sp. WMMD1082 TaxID=3016104 RepID=UPI00241812EE|nr:hypothetical protein [Micromonospora sp. WMMD1082]MDG4792443.1 hypothetical protein [Micromonospora sp. WMMD1082]
MTDNAAKAKLLQIEKFCAERYPEQFAGVSLGADGKNNVVIYTRPAPELRHLVELAFPEVTVTVKDARHSRRELQGLRDQIARDLVRWRERGIVIHSIDIPPDGSAVEVHTSDPVHAAAWLEEEYETDAVVTTTKPASLLPPTSRDTPHLHMELPQRRYD